MKSLLSISLLSVMLNMCNQKAPEQQPAEETKTEIGTSNSETEEASVPVTDEAVDEQPQSSTSPSKPAYKGEMPDTSRKQVTQHGSPDKARNDSIKASKTKGKF